MSLLDGFLEQIFPQLEDEIRHNIYKFFENLNRNLEDHRISISIVPKTNGGYQIQIDIDPKASYEELYELAQGGSD